MAEKNPFENIFYRIEELLQIINDAEKIKFSSDLPPHIQESLHRIEKDVALFSKISEEAFIKTGLSPSEIKELANLKPDDASPKSKKVFMLSEKLKLEFCKKSLLLSRATARKKKGLHEKDPFKSVLHRKKRFKKVGGDQNWIPL